MYICFYAINVKITIEELVGVGKDTPHRAVSLRHHGFLVPLLTAMTRGLGSAISSAVARL